MEIEEKIRQIFKDAERFFIEEDLKELGFERWAVTLIPNNTGLENADYLHDPWTREPLRVQWDEEIWVRQIKQGDDWIITHVLLVDWINCHYVLLKRISDGDF